jgi:hypothetical protein
MEHPVSHNQEIPTESLRRRKSLIWQDLLESQQNRCPVRLTKPGRISNALTDIGRCFVVGRVNQACAAFGRELAGRLMRSFRILYSSDVLFIPNRCAAPVGPPTTQWLASSARRM